MNANDILSALQTNPAMQLSTIGLDGWPKVRGMLLYSADSDGIVFHTGNFKEVYRELKACPHAELCFMDQATNTQIRVSGDCLEVEDPVFRDHIIASPGREFLTPMVQKWGKESIRVFRLTGGKASEWSFKTNGEYPKPVISL